MTRFDLLFNMYMVSEHGWKICYFLFGKW